jgi:hypothetical protein
MLLLNLFFGTFPEDGALYIPFRVIYSISRSPGNILPGLNRPPIDFRSGKITREGRKRGF